MAKFLKPRQRYAGRRDAVKAGADELWAREHEDDAVWGDGGGVVLVEGAEVLVSPEVAEFLGAVEAGGGPIEGGGGGSVAAIEEADGF